MISAFTDKGLGARWSRATLDAMFAFLSVMPASKYRPVNSARPSTSLACGFHFTTFLAVKLNIILLAMVRQLCQLKRQHKAYII